MQRDQHTDSSAECQENFTLFEKNPSHTTTQATAQPSKASVQAAFVASALAQLPPTQHKPADIARAFLVARGLPQDRLGWLGDIGLLFADKTANRAKVGAWSWGALTANGAALILPCLRWVDGTPKISYIQSLLVKQDGSGVWRKEGRGVGGMDKLYPSKKNTGLEKRGAFSVSYTHLTLPTNREV